MTAVANVTKKGIYRSATGVINALLPSIDMVTVQLVDDVATTSQRVYFPSGIKNIKGVMSWLNGGSNLTGTAGGRGQSNVGWSDGTNSFSIEQWVDSELSPNPMESLRNHNTVSIARFTDVAPYTNPPNRAHDITGFGDGYVDIAVTVDSTGDLARFVTLVAFGGPEVTNAEVWTKDDLGTGTSAVTVSGLGFAPDMTYIGSIDEPTALSTWDDVNLSGKAESKFSFGFALNQATNPQGSWGIAATDGEAEPVDLATIISNTKCLSIVTDAGVIDWTVTCDNWVSDGFDLTPSASTSDAICGGMALKFSDDFKVEMFDVTIPTSGNYTQSLSGYAHGAMLFAMHGASAYDTATTAAAMCEMDVFITDRSVLSAVTPYISGVTDNDGASRSRLEQKLVGWEFASGGPAARMLQSTGYTISTSQIDFTLDTWPGSEIIGIGLSYY